jgi:hypothetical protein
MGDFGGDRVGRGGSAPFGGRNHLRIVVRASSGSFSLSGGRARRATALRE